MKPLRSLPPVIIVSLLALLLVASTAYAASLNYRAHMQGRNEIPAVSSQGQGQANFQLSKDGTSLSYKLIVTNLEGITQSHIHCGTPDANGPVVAFLFGLEPAGVKSNGVLAEGTITAANVIARPDSAACPGGVADFDDLVEKIQTGGAYVNVHTLAHPPGEIRGHIH